MDASYIPIAKARGFTTHWIIKSKKRKKNAFSENCSRRRAASSNKEKRYQELLERALLGALTSDEQEEFERLSAERGSK